MPSSTQMHHSSLTTSRQCIRHHQCLLKTCNSNPSDRNSSCSSNSSSRRLRILTGSRHTQPRVLRDSDNILITDHPCLQSYLIRLATLVPAQSSPARKNPTDECPCRLLRHHRLFSAPLIHFNLLRLWQHLSKLRSKLNLRIKPRHLHCHSRHILWDHLSHPHQHNSKPRRYRCRNSTTVPIKILVPLLCHSHRSPRCFWGLP